MRTLIVSVPFEDADKHLEFKIVEFYYKYQVFDQLDAMKLNGCPVYEVSEFCSAVNKDELDTEEFFFFPIIIRDK